jgi:hypothetical protein
VVSDHGHVYPQERYDLNRPERYHIPLFLFGGALKEAYKGQVVSEVVSQVDLVSTLAGFVKANGDRFRYSRNLFRTKKAPSAFINSNNTLGIITADQAVTYDLQGQRVSYVQKEGADNIDSLTQVVKAYYQTVFNDFQQY